MATPDYTGGKVDYTGGFDQAAAEKALSQSIVDRPEDMGTLEGLQSVLGAGGMVLDPLDWINASIYASKGDYKNAALYASGVGLLGVVKGAGKIKKSLDPMQKKLKAYEKESKLLAKEDLLTDASFKRYRNSAISEATSDAKYFTDKIKFHDELQDMPNLNIKLGDTADYKKWKQGLENIKDNQRYYDSKYFKQDYMKTVGQRIDDAKFSLGDRNKGYLGEYTANFHMGRNSSKPGFFGNTHINRQNFSGPKDVGKIKISPDLLELWNKGGLGGMVPNYKHTTGVHEIKHGIQENMKRYIHSIERGIPEGGGASDFHKQMKLMESMNIKPNYIHKDTWKEYVKRADDINATEKMNLLSNRRVTPWELHADYLTEPAEISARLTQFRLNPSKNTSYYGDLKKVFGQESNIKDIANKYWAAAPVGLLGYGRRQFEE